MKNDNIPKILKEYRRKNHLSVDDVVIRLEEKDTKVAKKTIYGWESGQSQPSADKLLLLCEIYNITDILGTFGYTTSSDIVLTKGEEALIKSYRNHPQMQAAVNKLLELS